jgi:hypothetical protein
MDNAQLRKLLEPPKKGGGGKKGPRKPAIDVDDRSIMVWFKLAHRSYDYELHREIKCENPNCIDPRGKKVQMCAEVHGNHMCRFCFLDGWLVPDSNQMVINA